MKIATTLLGLIIFICLFYSCNNSSKYATEIKQLDSLNLLLDSTTRKFNSIDTAKLHKQLNEIEIDLKVCEENIKDTLSITKATLLSEYNSCIKPFKIILERYASYTGNLAKSKKQIGDLIHDLKIDKVDDDKIASYLQNEFFVASKTVQSTEMCINYSKIYSEKFELNKPKITAFIDSLIQ